MGQAETFNIQPPIMWRSRQQRKPARAPRESQVRGAWNGWALWLEG